MKKPIKLYIPDFYGEQLVIENGILLTKTKSLSKESFTDAKYFISIEQTENYKCNLPNISDREREVITNNFKSSKLSLKIANCDTYALNWHNFIVRWIAISEKYVLQLMVLTKPQYLAFHTSQFSRGFYETEVDKDYDYSEVLEIDKVFAIEFLKEAQTQNENILNLADSLFSLKLKKELEEKEDVQIESFICKDWNMYYDLHNPENLSDPDSSEEWEDNSKDFDYYEKPLTDNLKVTIVCSENTSDFVALKSLIANYKKVEQKLLQFFEHYTFGNGGAYAGAIHYQWAKTEIERLHGTIFTNQEFLKKNLCLQDIIITDVKDELKLYFKCSWDTEHGIDVIVDKNFECRLEE